MRLLIVGGGIAGLTLALALQQRGIRAELIENASSYNDAGYVIGLWPAGLNVLYSLGLRDALQEAGLPGGLYVASAATNRVLLRADFGAVAEEHGAMYLFARSTLIDVLSDALETPVAFCKTVLRLRQSPDAVEVEFQDRSTAEYDAVIGADGLRSAVRDLAFGPVRLSYHGITGWAFWADMDLGNATKEFYGEGRFMGFYPSRERTCCFAAMSAPRGRVDDAGKRKEHLERAFAAFPPEAVAALKGIAGSAVWHDDFLDVELERWSRGRISLVGDAAHAILPTAGVGASMAIESAFVLADEISRASVHTLPEAFRRCEERRRRRVDSVQWQSRQMAWMVRVNNPVTTYARDTLMRLISPSRFLAMFKGLMSTEV